MLKLSTILLIILTLCLMLSCDRRVEDRRTNDSSVSIQLREYYPFRVDGSWSFNWENNRGDRWQGMLSVTDMTDEEGYTTYIVVDTTIINENIEVSRSAYMWDSEGLKHLYRVAANGDSTYFRPARIVLPSNLNIGKDYNHNYHYNVFSVSGDKIFSGDVRQKYRLIGSDRVVTPYGKWDKTAVIESIRIDDYPNKTTQVRRQVIWYAENVGPVKIITGIPLETEEFTGETTGQLVATR